MKYSVYQHWDPLKVCIVGRSYNPEFYKFIENDRVRTVMERIARETEEDYQKLINLLESFGVRVLRPTVSDNYQDYIADGKISIPPMTPRDYTIMHGGKFFFSSSNILSRLTVQWEILKGDSWPAHPPATDEEFRKLPDFIKKEICDFWKLDLTDLDRVNLFDGFGNIKQHPTWEFTWRDVADEISKGAEVVTIAPACFSDHDFNAAMVSRIGRDVYIGTQDISQPNISRTRVDEISKYYPHHRWHVVDTGGHADGTFCPVVPGLIVSLYDVQEYEKTFPGWEVIYLPDQSWRQVSPFLTLKEKNQGKWWVPGEELNDEFTDFVEEWLGHWVGYVEETVFDVNMLVIDKHNVVCNNYNKEVFDAFERRGITPHIINFRHRYFWDGGLHCITSDVHREGEMEDYFPERN